jgi:hypothetical protein
MMEVPGPTRAFLRPYTMLFVRLVDGEGRRRVVTPPVGWLV